MRTDNKQLKLPLQASRDLRHHVMAQPYPDDVKQHICALIERETELSKSIWGPFMLVDMFRYRAVSRWMQDHSRRALKGVAFWERCMEAADRFNGEVDLDRHAVAAEMGISPQDVSRLLGDLVKCNALIRERKGGKYHYRLNRLVGTNLSEAEGRTALQRLEPEIVGVTGRWPHIPHLVDDDVLVSMSA